MSNQLLSILNVGMKYCNTIQFCFTIIQLLNKKRRRIIEKKKRIIERTVLDDDQKYQQCDIKDREINTLKKMQERFGHLSF